MLMFLTLISGHDSSSTGNVRLHSEAKIGVLALILPVNVPELCSGMVAAL
jgi:hypothetical protein